MEDNTRTKSFQCNQCNKYFSNKQNLQRHQKVTHDGIRDFKCDKCEMRFGYKRTLIEHIEAKHEKKHFKCSECSVIKTSRKALWNHIRFQHKNLSAEVKIEPFVKLEPAKNVEILKHQFP